jgi:CRISPR-associated protein Cas1
MVKRTIEISRAGSGVGQYGVHLAARDGQLLILTKTEPPRPLPADPPNLLPGGSVPIEDIGLVMVDQREASYSHHALVSLAQEGAAVVLCGPDHLPGAMVLPLAEHTQLQSRLRLQIDASAPTLKRCWQAVVRAKLRAQAATVVDASARRRLLGLAERTRSGDPDNAEGTGAAIYWPALFEGCTAVAMPFRRIAGEGRARQDRDLAPPPNNLLDYGYAALRAMVARALISAGLLPALGIKHVGRANAFNLADDLMEPLRPIIDARVKYLAVQVDNARELQLDPTTKAELLKVLAEPVVFPSATRPGTLDKGPLMVGITRMVASFVRVLEGGVADAVARLDFPALPHWPSTASRAGGDSTDSASTPPDTDEQDRDGP